MIFINSAIRQFGENALIINYKAKQFFNGQKLGKEDFDRLFSVFAESGNIPRFTHQARNNMILTICYFDADYNQNAANYYHLNFKENIYEKVSGASQKIVLNYLFNLIEFEIKNRTKSNSELKGFFNALNSLSGVEKNFEEYLLMNYYFGVLQFLLKDYDSSFAYSTSINIDVNEQIKKNQIQQSDLIKCIQIRNFLLIIKTYENSDSKGNKNEIISNIECLFELCKGQKEDFAITLGIKLNEYQNTGFECSNCIKTLEELITILHKEMLYGRSHSNIINQFIYISALLGYYNSLVEKFDQVKRFSNKIDKNIAFLREFSQIPNNKNSTKHLPQFEFLNILLKKMSGSLDKLSKDQSQHLENYKRMLGDNINGMDNVIYNIFILTNGKDSLAKSLYKNKEDNYSNIISNNQDLKADKILNCYLYLYNKLSLLSNKIKSNKNAIQELRIFSKKIIDYTINKVSINDFLKDMFVLSYFKDIFNRIYYSYIYSFYFEGKYEESIKEFNHYNDLIKIQFELNTNSNQKSYLDILKIGADSYFKLNQFDDASKIYSSIIPHNKENGLIRCNLGLCFVNLNEKQKAYEQFKLAYSYFQNKKDSKKCSIIQSLLDSLN